MGYQDKLKPLATSTPSYAAKLKPIAPPDPSTLPRPALGGGSSVRPDISSIPGGAIPRFVGSMATEIARPFVRAGLNVANAGIGVFNPDLAKKIDQEGVDLPVFGRTKEIGMTGKGFGRDLTDTLGTGLEMTSTLAPALRAPKIAATTVGGKILKGAAQGAIAGAQGGTAFGVGREMQNPDASVKSVAIEGAKGLGFGAAGGAVIGAGLATPKAIQNFKTRDKVTPVVEKRMKELQKITDNNGPVKRVVTKHTQKGINSQRILAETDLLHNSVDDTGTIRTSNAQQELNDFLKAGPETVISKTLRREGVSIPPDDVRKALLQSVEDSGLQGGAYTRALKNVEDDMAGYVAKVGEGKNIPLELIHDAKVDKYANINYLNPESKRADKAIAKGLKTLVEDHTRSADVKALNRELQAHYSVLDLLEKLDGKKVEGGRLGRYFKSAIGATVGSHFGPLGTIAGAEAGARLQGAALSRKLSGKTGNVIENSPVMNSALARTKAPPLALPAPRPGTPKVQNNMPIPLRGPSSMEGPAKVIDRSPLGQSNKSGSLNQTQPPTTNSNSANTIPKSVSGVKKKPTEVVPTAALGSTGAIRNTAAGDTGAALGKAGEWPTTASKPSKAGDTSTGNAPTERRGVSAQKTDTSGPFDGETLYHGTHFGSAEKIAKDGFLVPEFAQNGQILGRGVYFTNDANVARRFAEDTFGRLHGPSSVRVLETKLPPNTKIKEINSETLRADPDLQNEAGKFDPNKVAEKYSKLGYDGLRVAVGSGRFETVIFEPSKLKATIVDHSKPKALSSPSIPGVSAQKADTSVPFDGETTKVYRGSTVDETLNGPTWVTEDKQYAGFFGDKITEHQVPDNLNILNASDAKAKALAREFYGKKAIVDVKYGDDSVWYDKDPKFAAFLQEKGYDGFINNQNMLVFDHTKLSSPSIPKELEPLAAEARKYKSAEEFGAALSKRTGGTPDIAFEVEQNKLLGGFGARAHQMEGHPTLGNTDKLVTVYRGTPKGASREGLVYGDMVALTKERAAKYGDIQTFQVPENKLIKSGPLHDEGDLFFADKAKQSAKPMSLTDFYNKVKGGTPKGDRPFNAGRAPLGVSAAITAGSTAVAGGFALGSNINHVSAENKPRATLSARKPVVVKDRQVEVQPSELDTLRKVLYAEIGSRSAEKTELEARVVANVALNRVKKKHLGAKSLQDVLTAKSQFQGYGSPLYQKFDSEIATSTGKQRLEIIDKVLKELESGDLKDNVNGYEYYKHLPDGRIIATKEYNP